MQEAQIKGQVGGEQGRQVQPLPSAQTEIGRIGGRISAGEFTKVGE